MKGNGLAAGAAPLQGEQAESPATEIAPGFVIRGEFVSKKHGTSWNFLYDCRPFLMWGSDPSPAKRFDTRALARRCGAKLGRKFAVLSAAEAAAAIRKAEGA